MLACNCLNVIIESETNDFQKVTLDSLNLTEAEKEDNFFKQEILQVGKLTKINKIHSGLIETRLVGSWIVYQCINCSCYSHAIHRDRGAACVLVAAKLLNFDAIKMLRGSDKYSAIFNLIVNSSAVEQEEDKPIDNFLPSEVETNIKGLRQVVSDIVKREMLATEEKIRQFTEEQYRALDDFRDKAFREQRALTRIILNNNLKKSNLNQSTKKEMSTHKSDSKLPDKTVPEVIQNQKSPIIKMKHKMNSNSSLSNKRTVKSTSRSFIQANSLDAEGLFEFDGSDDVRLSYSEADDSDNEECGVKDDSGSRVQRNKNQSNLAKSLPMNIPAFMSLHNHVNEDSDDSFMRPEDPLDIAASIKALAKSVHGDTVFGDLPRPRFSTQI